MRTIPTVDMKRTGERINELRKMRGLSVKDIQKELGLAVPGSVYAWLNGYTMPVLDNLVVLARVLDVKVDDILVTEEVVVDAAG